MTTMPPEALHHAKQALIHFGFDTRAIVENQSLSISNNETIVFNALAYAHAERRTAKDVSFTIFHAANGRSDEALVPLLAQSTAPFHLIHRDNHFSFWLSKAISKSEIQPIRRHDHITYGQLSTVLERYAVDFKPQRILDFKQHNSPFPSFPELEPLQLALFALEATGNLLKDHFKSAANELRHNNIADETVSQLAIQLLGVIILADTGLLGEKIRVNRDHRVSIYELIKAAQQKPFGAYFDLNLFQQNQAAIESAYNILGRLHYASFEPHHIADLSLSAYNDAQREHNGLYDTPLYLTQRIWDNIPVEFLPPDQRQVADMTCGWGSFLISGYDRLANLSDMRDQPMNHYLHGNDVYGPQHLWAKLGLLLSTSRDNWDIQNQDAFAWNWLQHHQPNIIVGNPPFLGDGNKSTAQSEGQRTEKANQFFQYAIEHLADGGYLAMLMPRTLTSNPASYNLRKLLLKTCDVFELWEIPKDMFEASVRACVVFARKRITNEVYSLAWPVRIRTIQPNIIDGFREMGTFTHSQIVTNQTNWNETSHRAQKGSKPKNTYIMEYKLILTEDKWNTIHALCQELRKVTIIFIGAEKGHYKSKNYPQPNVYPKQVKRLAEARTALEQDFLIIYDNQLIEVLQYPDNFSWPRLKQEAILLGIKTILTSNHDPSWGQRVRVAIEREGYCVSDNFWCISPKPSFQEKNITHEVIAAVLHWKVANAWIIEHMRSPKLPGYAIKTIPFPPLTTTECKSLKDNVERIENATQKNDELGMSEAQFNIDVILKQAYQLDEETFERLCRVYYWDKPNHPHFKRLCHQYGWKANPITLDQQPDPNAWWEISGITEEIYSERGEIKLWLDGWKDFETVPIVDFMPGWLLRPDVAFRTTIPRECVRERSLKKVSWGKFYPQEYTYMSEEELFADLTDFFYPDDSEHEV